MKTTIMHRNILLFLSTFFAYEVLSAQGEHNLRDSRSFRQGPPSRLRIPIQSGDQLTNLTAGERVLLLVPSGVNISELEESDSSSYNLFKLNTDILLGEQNVNNNNQQHDSDSKFESESEEDLATSDGTDDREARLQRGRRGAGTLGDIDILGVSSEFRESRKMNFLSGMWNKPRTSPLYLVNGTVCRFVNMVPICTTLSTTGLLPAGGSTARPATSGQLQGGGSSNQFSNNQQMRPAAIIDDDAQDINVGTGSVTSNLTSDSSTNVRGQQQQQNNRPMMTAAVMQASRPLSFVVNRPRPLNLLSLRRPGRQFQKVNG